MNVEQGNFYDNAFIYTLTLIEIFGLCSEHIQMKLPIFGDRKLIDIQEQIKLDGISIPLWAFFEYKKWIIRTSQERKSSNIEIEVSKEFSDEYNSFDQKKELLTNVYTLFKISLNSKDKINRISNLSFSGKKSELFLKLTNKSIEESTKLSVFVKDKMKYNKNPIIIGVGRVCQLWFN